MVAGQSQLSRELVKGALCDLVCPPKTSREERYSLVALRASSSSKNEGWTPEGTLPRPISTDT